MKESKNKKKKEKVDHVKLQIVDESRSRMRAEMDCKTLLNAKKSKPMAKVS